ncbi:hypothetical protein DMENIID0001_034900 [Sergentomyia squamirostris]
MQHHPGSWYLPWGVPLQKMLVPLHPSTAGFHQQAAAAAAAAAQSGAVQVTAATQQAPQQQNYQHIHHPAAALHHPSAGLHQAPMHPAAAAAMFTPISLRTFLGPSHNLNLGQQTLSGAVQATQPPPLSSQTTTQMAGINLNVGVVPVRQTAPSSVATNALLMPVKKVNFLPL